MINREKPHRKIYRCSIFQPIWFYVAAYAKKDLVNTWQVDYVTNERS